MHKGEKTKSYTLYASFIPIFILGLFLLAVVTYFSTNAVMDVVSGKSVLSSQSKVSKSKGNVNPAKGVNAKSNQPVLADYEPKANARKYGVSVSKAVIGLVVAANKEKKAGNTDTSEKIQEVAFVEEGASGNVTHAIQAIETRSKWQKLLSPDYKNLGQLRSFLAFNTNTIRKLSSTLSGDGAVTAGSQAQDQLQVLLQERERIISVIKENESQFSILGWATRLITGYDDTPIDSVNYEGSLDAGTVPDGSLNTGTQAGDTLNTGTGADDTLNTGTEAGGSLDAGTGL